MFLKLDRILKRIWYVNHHVLFSPGWSPVSYGYMCNPFPQNYLLLRRSWHDTGMNDLLDEEARYTHTVEAIQDNAHIHYKTLSSHMPYLDEGIVWWTINYKHVYHHREKYHHIYDCIPQGLLLWLTSYRTAVLLKFVSKLFSQALKFHNCSTRKYWLFAYMKWHQDCYPHIFHSHLHWSWNLCKNRPNQKSFGANIWSYWGL